MEALKKNIGFIAGASVFGLIVKCLSFVKVSYIFGSHAAFFSADSTLLPLSGAYGLGFSYMAMGVGIFMKIVMGINPIFYLLYHIPSFCGALFWAGARLASSFVIPLLCIIAFVVHPEGGPAWMYTLYWIIPMVIYFSGYKHLFTDALSCTFIMHAAGSVLWLYGTHIPTAVWVNLIPVVAVERLLLAIAMTGAYVVIHAVANFVNTKGIARFSR